MIMPDTLVKIKRRLGILDDSQDDLLNDLIEDAESHFRAITGALTIDERYAFIIRGAVAVLYNRKGSESMASETVDGYSVSYRDISSAFDEYMPILERDFHLSDQRQKGSVRFL